MLTFVERARLGACVVLAKLFLLGVFMATAPTRVEALIPFTAECKERSWQAGMGPETRMCTLSAACQKGVTHYGNVGTFQYTWQGGSGTIYCQYSSYGSLPATQPYAPGNVQCPANSKLVFYNDTSWTPQPFCQCLEGFDDIDNRCVPRSPVVIELLGRSSTKALPAGPALPMVARVTRGGQPYATPGNEIVVRLNGQVVANGYGYPTPEIPFNYVPGTQPGLDEITATCTACSNTATKAVTVAACESCGTVGNPINPATGEKVEQEQDLADASPHPLNFIRFYGSKRTHDAGMGSRWSHNWAASVQSYVTEARVNFGTGQEVLFARANGSQPWKGSGTRDLLETTANGFTYTRLADETRWNFDSNGRLLSIVSRNGWSYQLAHDAAGNLVRVTNAFGRALNLSYTASRLTGVSAPDGQAFGYAYSTAGLVAATAHDGSSRRYHYENTQHPTALTGISDESGARLATFHYDGHGRAVSTQHAGGAQPYSVNYVQPVFSSRVIRGAVDPGIFTATSTISDPSGGLQQRSWVGGDGEVRMVGASSPAGHVGFASRGPEPLPLNEVDFAGVETRFTWDTERALKTVTTEAANKPEARSTRTTWHPAFRLPVLITEAGRTTAYAYDGLGNPLTETVTDTTTGEARTTRWEYGSNNLPSAMTDAKGGVWRYGYDAAGNRTSTRNPLGQETHFTYDGAGRVLKQTEPGGLVTSYTYDSRGRLLSQSRAGETSSFTYTVTGLLASATQPNGYSVGYTYDAAQRLTGATDNRGAAIAFTLDAAGNRVGEQVKDASGTIALATSLAINTLNQVAAVRGASGQSTQLGYDANGELVSQTDPLNQTTRQTLDALRRTTATTFADDAVARQSWNALDQLTGVTDPKGVATGYTVNAFGEVTSETSPDIGTITFQRDANGDVIETRDAKGQVTKIERDALGRPVAIRYHGGSVSTFTYDAAGFVAKIDDNSGSTAYTRDAQGRVLTRTTTVLDNPANPGTLRVAYSYTNGDLTGITYPSGLKARYQRTAGRITGIDLLEPGKNKTWVPFVRDLTYTALGQPKSWTWFNGDIASRTFDADGRMTSNEFARYTYDAAGRMVGITQDLWASRTVTTGTTTTTELYKAPITWTAGYDKRNRLTSFERAGAGSTYTYDANSNRLTAVETQGSEVDLEGTFDQPNLAQAASQTLKVEAGSNRLLGFTQTLVKTHNGQPVSTTNTNVNYSVDENGSMTSDGLRNFVYDDTGRLAKVEVVKDGEAAAVRYLHNALGQRVFKSEPEVARTLPSEEELGRGFVNWLRKNFGWLFAKEDVRKSALGQLFVYGDSQLPSWSTLGEYDNGSATGREAAEYIWLPDRDGSGVTVGVYKAGKFYALHTDHLGTPRQASGPRREVVWQWTYSAFGDSPPSGVLGEEAGGRIVLTTPGLELNGRFMGQYSDRESNLIENGFRTYSATAARYIQPDPAGMNAGLNRYLYANADALRHYDPLGLWALGDPLDQRIVDAAAGFGDALSWNTTAMLRELIKMNGANKCSAAYAAGEYGALGFSFLLGGAHFGRHATNVGAARFFFDNRAYSTVQRQWSRSVGGYKGQYELHHWFTPQSAGGTSAGWNMTAMSPTANRMMSDGGAMYSAFRAAFVGTYLGAFGSGPTALSNFCECAK